MFTCAFLFQPMTGLYPGRIKNKICIFILAKKLKKYHEFEALNICKNDGVSLSFELKGTLISAYNTTYTFDYCMYL